MKEEQIYNPVAGVNRMIDDIESFVNPMIFRLQPVLRIMSMINLFLVIALFAWLLYYLIAIRKHRIKDKITDNRTYIFSGVMLAIYAFLNQNPIKPVPQISISLALFVMPLFAKKQGPVMACIFGILQYGVMFVLHSGEQFSLTAMLLGSISGMLYGRFLYKRKITYLRCLLTKLLVNMVCNVILVPVVINDSLTSQMADIITRNVVSNIFLAPIQAVLIYAVLISYKKVEVAMTEN